MLRLAIAGCGVMGRRHVLGLGKLRDVDRTSFDLVAACDPVPENAAALADLAKRTLGARPRVFASLEAMAAGCAIDALDLTTAPASHPTIAREALAIGWHVMVEKPITLTVRDGRDMIAAARQAARVLAVAENYRRDPINRLARALLDAGAIGRPYLAMQTFSAWGEQVIITPWRHRKAAGGIAIDMGVHYADILEYLLGPIRTVVGMSALVDTVRRAGDGAQVVADAEDLTVGVARFASGALASWTLDLAGRGEQLFTRRIHGTGGTLDIPNDRTGQPLALTVTRSGAPHAVSSADQLELVPDFTLDPTTAALFGGERLASYDLPWADIDANVLAIELDDFARAVTLGGSPEVSGEMGLRSLAIAYAFLESERAGRILAVEEIMDGRVTPYQDAIEAALNEGTPRTVVGG
jgi:predicted dehydrogenase